MARPLAVEGETAPAGADLDDALASSVPAQRFDCEADGRGSLAVSWFQRVFRESRQNVGEEQLLVLLLVVDAELDQLQRFRRQGRKGSAQRLIHMFAIGADFVEGGPAQHAPSRPGVARALGLIITVEQEGVALVERRVAEHVVAEHEGLEEPRRVREVPLGRRGIGERLDSGVGVGQRRGEVERQLAGSAEAPEE